MYVVLICKMCNNTICKTRQKKALLKNGGNNLNNDNLISLFSSNGQSNVVDKGFSRCYMGLKPLFTNRQKIKFINNIKLSI